LELPEIDKAGVRRPSAIRNKLRARMSQANAEVAPKVTAKDLNEIENH
jgi:ubiquinol-cytochrome c reductase cytochrome b subunit